MGYTSKTEIPGSHRPWGFVTFVAFFGLFVGPPARATAQAAGVLFFKPSLGAGLSSAGLLVADVDGDGESEILTGGGDGSTGPALYWAIFERDPCCPHETVFYQDRANVPTGGFSYALAATQLDNDPQSEIVVAEIDEVLIYDSKSAAIERRFEHSLGMVRALAVADLDGDGAPEAVLSGDENSSIISLRSGRVLHVLNGMSSDSLAIGEMDGTPGLEVAFVGGSSQDDFVVDGTSGKTEWLKPGGFGYRAKARDVDHDGLDELFTVRTSPSSGVSVFDIDKQSLKYEIPISSSLSPDALVVGDLEGDGSMELLVHVTGALRVYNGSNGRLVRQIPRYVRAIDFALYDFDDDGVKEIVFVDGVGQSGSDTYVSIMRADGSNVWTSDNYRGPFSGAGMRDLDGDGRVELVLLPASSRGERAPGHYQVLDFSSGRREYSAPVPAGANRWSSRLRVADLDGDGSPEIVVAENPGRRNGVAAYDGLTHELQWRYTLEESEEHFCGMALGELDDDAVPEVVLSTRNNGSGSAHVVVLDGGTGLPEWLSPGLPVTNRTVCSLRLGQVDDDRDLEVIAGALGAQFVVLSPVEGTIDLVTDNLDLASLEVVDWDLDGQAEVLVGDRDGRLLLVDPRNGSVLTQLADLGDSIGSITALPPGLTGPRLVVGAGHSLYLLDTASEKISAVLDLPFGEIGWGDSVQLLGPARRKGRFLLSVSGGPNGFGRVGVVVVEVPGRLAPLSTGIRLQLQEEPRSP